MTPAQRESLMFLASSWRAVAAAASSNTRTMLALGVRTDRVFAAEEVAGAAEKLAAELDAIAREGST